MAGGGDGGGGDGDGGGGAGGLRGGAVPVGAPLIRDRRTPSPLTVQGYNSIYKIVVLYFLHV